MSKQVPLYQIEQTVYYDDTDCNGTVYHANYLKYMERARSEWLLNEFGREQWQNWGVLFVVSHADVQFVKPAGLYDRLLVEVDIDLRGRCHVVFQHKIIDQKSYEQYAVGHVKVVCLSPSGRVKRLPHEINQVLAEVKES